MNLGWGDGLPLSVKDVGFAQSKREVCLKDQFICPEGSRKTE